MVWKRKNSHRITHDYWSMPYVGNHEYNSSTSTHSESNESDSSSEVISSRLKLVYHLVNMHCTNASYDVAIGLCTDAITHLMETSGRDSEDVFVMSNLLNECYNKSRSNSIHNHNIDTNTTTISSKLNSEMSYIDKKVLSAISRGEPKLLQSILNNNHSNYIICKEAVALVMKGLCHFINGYQYEQCFKLIMEAIPEEQNISYVNYKDAHGRVPLEYLADFCIRNGGLRHNHNVSDVKGCEIDNVVGKLLDKGASFADEASTGDLIITKFSYGDLKQLLDTRITDAFYDNMDFCNMLPSKLEELKGDVDICRILFCIHNSYSLCDLVKHPLISTFLIYVSKRKWAALCHVYYIKLGFYLVFYLSILLQMANMYLLGQNRWLNTLYPTCGLMASNIVEYILPKRYINNAENYFDVRIVMTTITAASAISSSQISDQLMIFAFLFSTLKLFLLVGKHIKLIKYSLLFKAVFIKLYAFFVIIVIVISISLNVLFKPVKQHPYTVTDKLFSIYKSFKNTIMPTEDRSEINFENHPIGCHIALLLFITLISLILMNLIRGLAMSDIQRLDIHLKLYRYFATVEFLYEIETIIRLPQLKCLGKIHYSLNFFDNLCKSTLEFNKGIIQEDDKSSLLRLLTQLSTEDRSNNPSLDHNRKKEILRLTQLVEDINSKLRPEQDQREEVLRLTQLVENMNIKLFDLQKSMGGMFAKMKNK